MVDFPTVQIFAGCETGMTTSYLFVYGMRIWEASTFFCSTSILELESTDCMCHLLLGQNVIVLQLAKSVFVSPRSFTSS